jgi:hypothetical protein
VDNVAAFVAQPAEQLITALKEVQAADKAVRLKRLNGIH